MPDKGLKEASKPLLNQVKYQSKIGWYSAHIAKVNHSYIRSCFDKYLKTILNLCLLKFLAEMWINDKFKSSPVDLKLQNFWVTDICPDLPFGMAIGNLSDLNISGQ